MRTLTISLMFGVVFSLGCADAQTSREATIAVDVADDQGRALSGIPILLDDTPIATTDGHGHARAIVQAVQTGRVRVRAQCPAAYRDAEARSVALSRADAQTPPLTLRVICAPKLRTLAVVVRAPGGEGLTLRADGAPVAQVAADGTAHVVLQRAPETSLRLSLDTADAPKLSPQFPAREVQVVDRDEIVVFNQVLTSHTPALRRAAPKPTRIKEARHVPYAIGRAD
jgi:hypothetical protein